ncbi:MAG: 3-hydroxyisobutyrate dehydrogenase [Actinomycetota bacterium]|jgi:3-hydroxyisobutyrate dehydrogenase|nr:3-hydroxyisobutyrate dehydrogenase [Actinomycetota bacterium]MDQ1641201.1 3-hydroxyisobutyrate dehydrogenase [Actinomycetota bacterium]
MTTPPQTVAVLGTGTMGLPMARNLIGAGFVVRAWNRTRDKAGPLVADGATVHDSPGEAAQGADVLLTMLYDAAAVAAVAPEALDALAADAVWLQMSTVGLVGTEELANLAATAGVSYVDAPVLGTKGPAEQGVLTVLAAGPEEIRDRCAPVFDAVGSRTVWVDGPADGGTRLKLVANSWVLALNEAVAEAIALSERLDIDPAVFLETIKGGPTDSGYAQVKGASMIARSFPPSFALDVALKDAGLILDAAAAAGVDMAVTAAVQRHMARASELGHGDEDMAATYYAH